MRYSQTHAISERHNNLLGLVQEGVYSSLALAEKLGVSQPTVHRDIEFLRGQGHSIKSVRRAAGWAYQLEQEDKSYLRKSEHAR